MRTEKTKMNQRRIGGLLTATLLLLAACGAPQGPAKSTEEIPKIKDIPGVKPAALAAFNAAVSKLNKQPKDYVGAQSDFQAAVAADPDFWEALDNLGLVQMDLGQYSAAVDTFRREERLIEELISRGWPVSKRRMLQMSLGKALALGGRTADAADAFAKVLTEDPKDADAKANLAAVYVQQGDFAQARVFIGELLEMDQNEPGALGVLALIYKKENNMPMARYMWEKCIGEISGRQAAIDDEAQYKDLSEADAAKLKAFNSQKSDRLAKQLSDVQNELGVVAVAEGQADAAESFFKKAIENNPSNAAASLNLGAIYLDYANFEDACVAFGDGLALRPRDMSGMVGFAACTYGEGKVEAAYAAYQAAHEAFDQEPSLTEKLGDIAFRDMNDQKSAIRWFTKNLEQRGSAEATCDQRADKICSSLKALIQMAATTTPQTPADLKAFDKLIAPEEPEEETPEETLSPEGSGAEGSGLAPTAGSGEAP
jgi:Flp pilus assembly protein TadD